jgi:polyhydroxyalkanoate synthesis regulator phasin
MVDVSNAELMDFMVKTFATNGDLKLLVSKEDAKDLATKGDFARLENKVDKLERRVRGGAR